MRADTTRVSRSSWRRRGRVCEPVTDAAYGFNPRIEHFFLRGFLETKVDQLLWHVTAIDAAVGKEATSVAGKLARRILALTKNDQLVSDFKNVHYKLRSELVHGKSLSVKRLWESDLAAVRRVAREVVVSLVEFVAAHPDWSRNQVIGFLDRLEE